MTETVSQWYAVRTATRREQAAADGLEEQGFTVFLPMETKWRRTGIEKAKAQSPLMPGYLFVLCSAYQLRAVTAVDGVHQVVSGVRENGDPMPLPIPVAAIIELQASERAGVYDYTIGKRIKYEPRKGAKVKITAGPWQSFIAKVLSTPRGSRVHVMTEGPYGRGMTLDVAHLSAA